MNISVLHFHINLTPANGHSKDHKNYRVSINAYLCLKSSYLIWGLKKKIPGKIQKHGVKKRKHGHFQHFEILRANHFILSDPWQTLFSGNGKIIFIFDVTVKAQSCQFKMHYFVLFMGRFLAKLMSVFTLMFSSFRFHVGNPFLKNGGGALWGRKGKNEQIQ